MEAGSQEELELLRRRVRELEGLQRGEAAAPAPDGDISQRFRLAVDHVPALLSYIDRDQVYRLVNQTYTKWLRRSPGEILGKTLREVIGEPHATNAQPHIARVLAGECVHYESQMRHPDGELRDISLEYTPDISVSGEVRGFVALVQDITDRKAQSQERERMLAKLSGVLESIAEGLVVCDADGQILDFNPAALRMHGFMPGDPPRGHFRDVGELIEVHGIDGEPVPSDERPMARALRGESVVDEEYRLRTRGNGREWIASVNAIPVRDAGGRVVFGVVTLRDITERKRDEEALRRASQRLRSHLENTPLGLVDFDAEFRIVRWSRRAEEIFGWTQEEVRGKRPDEFRWIHEDDLSETQALLRELHSGKVPFVLRFQRNYRKDGAIVHCEWYNSALFDAEGRVESFLSLALDITDRVEALEALRLSEQRFRTALAGSGILVFNQDRDLRYTWLHSSKIEVDPNEVLGKTDLDLMMQEDADELTRLKRNVIETGETCRREVRVRQAELDRYFDLTVEPLLDPGGRVAGVTGSAVETTERRQMENALRDSNAALLRANADLEEFAYVASHDLQEPLRAISIYTQLILRRFPEGLPPEAVKYADFVRDGVHRMESLIRDLLSYSHAMHDRSYGQQPTNLQTSVEQALQMLEQQILDLGASVECGPMPTVQADPTQLAVVFQNLISNSLKYAKRNESPRVEISATRNGDEWVIRIHDSGIGFDARYADRIFGLFKRLHRDEYPGTGLGLAICRRILGKFGGRIWAESQPGAGATFFFTLPAA
jgi:PAS domain S-box-containing protein